MFAQIVNTFALIGLWRANFPYISSNLAYLLFIKTADLDLASLWVGAESNTLRWFNLYRM